MRSRRQSSRASQPLFIFHSSWLPSAAAAATEDCCGDVTGRRCRVIACTPWSAAAADFSYTETTEGDSSSLSAATHSLLLLLGTSSAANNRSFGSLFLRQALETTTWPHDAAAILVTTIAMHRAQIRKRFCGSFIATRIWSSLTETDREAVVVSNSRAQGKGRKKRRTRNTRDRNKQQ